MMGHRIRTISWAWLRARAGTPLAEFERSVVYEGAIFKDERSYEWLRRFGAADHEGRAAMLEELNSDG